MNNIIRIASTICFCTLALTACSGTKSYYDQMNDAMRGGEILTAPEEQLPGMLQKFTNELDAKPDATTYSLRGAVYERLNKYPQAIVDYSSAIEMAPKEEKLYVKRGEAQQHAGAVKLALKDFDEALKISPHNVDALRSRARAYSELKHYDKALADLNDALQHSIKVEKPMVLVDRADIYEDTNRIQEAIKDYTAATKFEGDPYAATAFDRRGDLYRKLGDRKKAAADHLEAANRDKVLSMEYDSAAQDFEAIGQKEDAKHAYEKALDCELEREKMDMGLDYVWAAKFADKCGKHDDATTYRKRGVEALMSKTDTESLSRVYELQEGLGDKSGLERTRKLWLMMLQKDFKPNEAQSWHDRGDALISMHMYKEAQADFEQALKMDRRNEDYKEHIQNCKDLLAGRAEAIRH